MEKFIKGYFQNFESSSELTAEFASYSRLFKRDFKKIVESLGGCGVEISRGHFYLSGFFTHNGNIFYISIDDVRNKTFRSLLIRTAESYKDSRGGQNNYIKLNGDFKENLKDFLERI